MVIVEKLILPCTDASHHLIIPYGQKEIGFGMFIERVFLTV
jgi:hypothetical protein